MPNNDDVDDFLKRQKALNKQLDPLESRASALLGQADALSGLFKTAATEIGEAAEKDKTDGVTGTTLKEFESAKHVKAEMAEVAKLVASAKKTEKSAEDVIDDAQTVQKAIIQVMKDIDSYLKVNKDSANAGDKKILAMVRADADKLFDQLDSRVIQVARTSALPSDSYMKTFRKNADIQVAKAKVSKEAEAKWEKDQYRFDKREVVKAMNAVKALEKKFDDEEDECKKHTMAITADAKAKAKAQSALDACKKHAEDIAEIAMDYRKHMASLDKKDLDKLHALQDFKKTQELLRYIDDAAKVQQKTLERLKTGISRPPPPKNPLPPGGLRK